MKKLFILLSYFFISLSIAAQKTPVKNNPNNNFCNALLKVIAQAPGQFEKLKTGGYLAFLNPSTGSLVGDGWVASINFPDAFLSNINPVENGPNTYNVYLGNYQSEADARKEAGIIKNKLSACLPGFTIEDRAYMENNFHGFPINFYFIEKKKGSSPQQIVNLYLGKDSSIHSIHLRIFGSDVNGTVLQAIMAKPVTADSRDVQTKFAKQMQQLLDYSKDGFKAIKGEEVKMKEATTLADLADHTFDQRIYWKFKTGFLPEATYKSEIRYYPDDKSTKFIASASYTYIFPELTFQKLFEKMKKELSDGFDYKADEESIKEKNYSESKRVVFYRKGAKLSRIELIYNKETDTLRNGMSDGILIVVEAPNSQSNITNAQVKKFDEQLSSIVADYANEFATIKGESKTTGSKGNFYSKFKLEGADSVYLTQNWTTRHLDFIAVYPAYSSKEEARGKFNELVAKVDKCRFPCCTFAKTDISEYSNMVVQGWLPFNLNRKMDATYDNILLEVEIHKSFEIDTKSEKISIKDVWQLVLRVKKL
jgi:hypothetical protein